MILDEPEARLHPDLLAPLARLILKASARCQIIVGSHAAPLVEDAERPRWTWPSR
ncbi:AAA family ATPase [Sphingomonas sp. Leaf21]|uniref:AAA family ATPase n=1 Tax=Sphingomonas sp. Leaf21 TaxID=2876550 RepID=UPI001E498F92|nr:AAA family ATPase [Sphingomonas sp. Leaf21]